MTCELCVIFASLGLVFSHSTPFKFPILYILCSDAGHMSSEVTPFSDLVTFKFFVKDIKWTPLAKLCHLKKLKNNLSTTIIFFNLTIKLLNMG